MAAAAAPDWLRNPEEERCGSSLHQEERERVLAIGRHEMGGTELNDLTSTAETAVPVTVRGGGETERGAGGKDRSNGASSADLTVYTHPIAGTCGFKGARRGMPFTAQTPVGNAIRTIVD
ncbi:hypothetical protein RJ639_010872 [Escallonia herrerae]|uniref:Uncharacterized protein n=1 Tax=Escallonia herrerae TaxID=1293975 RepID=A0AA88VP28_9ASTE|nr:hypothetical protein RJ639_010872 [Escallonia herrerae]